MTVNGAMIGINNYYQTAQCPDKLGCPSDQCPDVVVKRHDTKPAFKVLVEDCDGAFDMTDETLVVEVSMWSKAKLKKAISKTDDYFQLADNIGFQQIMVGDIIVMDRVRNPEHMLVIAFDEYNHLVQVRRAYSGTVASVWRKGTAMRIFRTMGASGSIESVSGDVINEDGSTSTDQLLESYLVYNWQPNDTCTPGCYWLEFKLLKMSEEEVESLTYTDDSISDISFTPSTLESTDFGCFLGEGVEWVRRFPNSEGFLVQIADSPTSEH